MKNPSTNVAVVTKAKGKECFATEPPHREELFNWSKILKIHLKDLVENNPFFHSFSEVILTSKPFS